MVRDFGSVLGSVRQKLRIRFGPVLGSLFRHGLNKLTFSFSSLRFKGKAGWSGTVQG